MVFVNFKTWQLENPKKAFFTILKKFASLQNFTQKNLGGPFNPKVHTSYKQAT
jgi:hypothetical protein